MLRFQEEAQAFGATKLAATARARQIVAMQLVCGIDLSALLAAGQEEQSQIVRKIERLIERERLKGLRRHWSYDLNRHIALKQVLDELRGLQPGTITASDKRKSGPKSAKNGNGARRRRESRMSFAKDA